MNTKLIDYEKNNKIKNILEKIQKDLPDRPIMKIYNTRGSLRALDFLWKLESNYIISNEILKKEFLKNFVCYDGRVLYRGLHLRIKEEINTLNDIRKIINSWDKLDDIMVSTSCDFYVAKDFSKEKMVPESYIGDNPILAENYYNVVLKIKPRLIYEPFDDLLFGSEDEVIAYGIEEMKIILIEKQLYLLEDEIYD